MLSDQDLFQQTAVTIAESNSELRVEPIFDGELPCVLVYSEQPGAGYLYPLISQLESVLREKGFRPGRAGSAKKPGADPYSLKKALAGCILGVVILDGLKPNTIYQLGQLIGRKKPVILLHSENVPVAVKSYYPSSETSGLDPQIFEHKLKEPALDWDFHLGNLGVTPSPINWQAPGTSSLHPIVALKRGLENNTAQIMDSILDLITQKLPPEAVPEMTAPLEVIIKSYYSRSQPAAQSLTLTEFETAVLQFKTMARRRQAPIPDLVFSIIAAVYLAKARELPWQATAQRINCLQAALGAYRELLAEGGATADEISPERIFLQADLQKKIGYAHLELARYQELDLNCREAVQANLAALEYFTREEFPSDYATVKHNLGVAYYGLAAGPEPLHYLELAKEAFAGSLEVYSLDGFPLNYALACYNSGLVFSALGRITGKAGYLKSACAAFQESLKVCTPDNFPNYFALAQQNLASAYFHLGLLESEPDIGARENYRLAIKALEAALQVWNLENMPSQYANLYQFMGAVFLKLAESEPEIWYFQKAISAYREACKVRDHAKFRQEYGLTQYCLGNAYFRLASVIGGGTGQVENYQEAVAAYQEALRVFTFETDSTRYAIIQHYLCQCFYHLAAAPAMVETGLETEAGYQKAIHAAKEALRILSPETPQPYQISMRCLGNAYARLGAIKGDGTGYRNAIAVYLELLDSMPEAGSLKTGEPSEPICLTGAGYPQELIHMELGDAYLNLAGLEPAGNHYPSAISAYQKALAHYTLAEYPADYARIWFNLGQACRSLAETLTDNRTGERETYCEQAITAYENAMLVYIPERYPGQYAATRHYLGLIYRLLAELTNKAANYRRAIENFREALRVDSCAAAAAARRQNLGDALLKLAEIEDTAANCLEAITVYEEALEYYTQGVAPENYALIQNNLGAAFQKLAETEGKAGYIIKAITAYQAALEVYNAIDFPLEFATTWKNIGIAYGILSQWEDRIENCKKSINAFKVSLTIYIREDRPLDYAMIQDCLGNAYSILAEAEDQAENYKRAAEAYEAVVGIYGANRCPIYPLPGGRLPLDYVRAKLNLGAAFTRLAEVKGDFEIYHQAINAYEDALNLYAIKQLPVEYFTALNNLGAAYRQLALKAGTAGPSALAGGVYYCQKATAAYQEALQMATLDSYPLFYAATQKNLGEAYAIWAKLEEPLWNWQKSLCAYNEALKVYSNGHPVQHCAIQQQLGAVYCALAELEEPLENYQMAVKCYQTALKIQTPDASPLQAASIQVLLGNCYLELARREPTATALYYEKTIITYQEALQFYSLESNPKDYAAIQINLGRAYTGLARLEARTCNCERAIQSYREALRIDLPGQPLPGTATLAGIYQELGGVYLLLAESEAAHSETAFQKEKPPQLEGKAEAYRQAILAYENAIKIYQSENLLEFAQLKAKTGDLRVKLAEIAGMIYSAAKEADFSEKSGGAAREVVSPGETGGGITNRQVDNLLQAAADYREAANILNLGNFPGQYGELQAKLGAIYVKLNDLEQLPSHCRTAILHYREALRVYRFDAEPLQYASISSSLGAIYLALAYVPMGGAYQTLDAGRETIVNTQLAISAFQEALRIYSLEKYPAQYAQNQFHLASAYEILARINKPAMEALISNETGQSGESVPSITALVSAENYFGGTVSFETETATAGENGAQKDYYSLAIRSYEESLKVNTWERFPLQYGAIWQRLIRIYQELATSAGDIAGTGPNNLKTILACKEALRVWTLESNPLEYAFACDHAGSAYARLAMLKDPGPNRQKAIEFYQKALQVYNLEQFSADYARIQHQIGDLHRLLLENDPQNEAARRIQALNAYQEALKVYNPDTFPIQYGLIQGYLGAVQATLSEEGLRNSIIAFKNALKIHEKCLTEAIEPHDSQFMSRYVPTLQNLGAAYLKLAGIEDPLKNYQLAIQTFQEVLRFSGGVFPPLPLIIANAGPVTATQTGGQNLPRDANSGPAQTLGSARHYLGLAHLKLADLAAGPALALENLEQAILYFQEALQLRTLEVNPIGYAATQAQLGHAFFKSALIENLQANCEEAIRAYQAALKVFQLEPAPEENGQAAYVMAEIEDLPRAGAEVLHHLGLVYQLLAKESSKQAHLEASIRCLEEALKVRTLEYLPLEYASSQLNLGHVYHQLAEFTDPGANYQLALESYLEALKVFTQSSSPQEYAGLQYHLGRTCLDLARLEDPAVYYRKAIVAFLEALKIYTPENHSQDFVETQFQLGNAYCRLAEIESKAENCKRGVKAYREALKLNIPAPLQYGLLQDQLGTAYSILAESEERLENYKKAITAFKEALKIYLQEGRTVDYAFTQQKIGTTYFNLAELENKAENCKKALETFKEASRILTLDDYPACYADSQHKLAGVYLRLAEVENAVINYKRGIKAYEEALQVRTFETYPVEYAKTNHCLGTAYSKLAEIEDKAENYTQAILNYSNTLKVYTVGSFPLQYAAIQNQIGIAYTALADFNDKARNCRLAVAAFKEALKVYLKESFPEEYALTQNWLGNAYRKLAEVEDKTANNSHAVICFEEVIKIYSNSERFPANIAAVQSNLGAAYRMLAGIKDTPENCQNAIKAYENALKIYNAKHQPQEYALILNNLGNVYHLLAENNRNPEDCHKALEKYKEALKINTLQTFPLQYAINHRDLGLAYHTLATLEDPHPGERGALGELALKERVENLKRSISAFNEALKVYRIKIPSQQAQVHYYLGAVYLSLAEVEEPLENYRRSLENYREAAKYFSVESFPAQYAATCFKLGQVYYRLAGFEEPARNYHLAIQSFQEVLPVWTLEKAPADFAMVYEQLGHTYQKLARYESGFDCYQHALAAYEETLKVYDGNNKPGSEANVYAYAATQRNLGIVYAQMAGLDDKTGNCRKAIRTLKEALNIFTVESYPAEHADILNRLGEIYNTLAGEEGRGDTYQKAVETYESLLDLIRRSQTPGVNIDYTGTLINLGNVYRRLAEIKDTSDNAQKAIRTFEEALKSPNIRHNLHEFLTVQQNLGAAYFLLAGTAPSPRARINYGKKAVHCLKEIQKGATWERFPQIYARSQTDLTRICLFLASQENKMDHLKLAISAAKKSLDIYSFDGYPLEYAAVYKTLGQIYRELADLEDRELNYKLAIEAFRESLRAYMRENLIVECAWVQNELGNLNSLIASSAGSASSYKEAITSYEEALKVQTSEIAPLQYANSKTNLGNEYLKLADFEDFESNCRLAIQSFRDALEIYTPDRFPGEYANVQTRLGHCYLKMAHNSEAAPLLAEALTPGYPVAEYCKNAITAFESALRVIRKDKTPLEYAEIMRHLGAAHLKLAEVEEPAVDSYQNAITALKAARSCLHKTPNRYVQVETELGNAYLGLGKLQETYLNCRRALRSFRNALKKVPFKHAATQYLTLLNNFGNAYSILAEITNKPGDYQRVIKIFREVLRIGALRALPFQSATAQLKLGNAYFALAGPKEDLELYRMAAHAYEEALKALPAPSTPSRPPEIPEVNNIPGARFIYEANTDLARAAAQFNLGRIYYILAGNPSVFSGNKIIVAAYQELTKSGATDELPPISDFEPFNSDTGYQSLSAVENKVGYCNRAIEAFSEALKTYTLESGPVNYAAAQTNLGNAYFRLAGVDYRAFNLHQAIQAYQNALKVWNREFFALQYANSLTNLGNAYIQLAKIEDLPGNCRQAILAYEAALQIYTLERFPLNFAITQDNLRNAYSMLAGTDNSLETYKLTFEACAAALKVFTRRRFPRKYRSLKYEEENLVKLLIYK
ncbi:MAG: tetratricopeptide repeat protein [Firmicutes bacterium]|nr:tetratricopeptide repeat protein [Bacillota bacterium]